ncbi:hypothetical protein HDA31_003442 [Micromonospora carbonacea subsp. aurantiaca]|nr:hypothetical protein [Micromonospora carbonacea]
MNAGRRLLAGLARVALTLAGAVVLVALYVVVFTRGEVLR